MKKYILPGILTILLLVVSAYSALTEEKAAVIPITAYVGSGTETEQIDCWADPDGVIYLFLPSYTDLKDVLIEKRDDWSVQIELQELGEPMSLSGYALGTPYRLSYGSGNLSCETTLVLMQSENLPAVYIDTQSGKMDYIHARKGNEEPGEIRVYNPDGALCHSGKIERMNGRGNATWEKSEKKPYSIKLEGEADLLEMGPAEKWILLANAQDPSHIRNKLANDLASTLGFPYTAQAEWVDLYLNGCYAGLYLLSERAEVHPQRVNLAESGFLVSMEKKERLDAQNYPYTQTAQGLTYRLHYPSGADMETNAALAVLLQSVENAILSEDGVDPKTGRRWDELVDTDSWVRIFLLCEISGNLDSFKLSQYFYGNLRDGIVFAGPIWDCDKAMGNDNDPVWSVANPDVFMVCRYQQDDFIGPRLISALLQRKPFFEKVVTLFTNEFYPTIEAELDGFIQQYESTIASAYDLNRIRWQSEVDAGPLREELAQVRDYIHGHIQFLHSAWVEEVPYCQVRFLGARNDQFRSVIAGQTLKDVPVAEDTQTARFLGWFLEGASEPFAMDTPIKTDMTLYARWADKSNRVQLAETMERISALIPLGLIGALGIVLLAKEIRRNGKK